MTIPKTIRKLINYWLKETRSGFYLFLAFVWSGIYFAGVMLESPSVSPRLKGAGFAGLLILVPICFIHRNLHSCHWFLDHFKDTDHLPRKQIALVNSFCMTLFLTASLIIMPAAAYSMEPVWQAIYRWFSSRSHPEDVIYPALPVDMKPAESPDLAAIFGEPEPTPPWLLAADQIVRVLGTLFVIIFFLMLIRGICRHIWSWIIRPRQFDDDEKIYLTPSWVLPSGDKSGSGRKLWFKFSSYNERIRRLYRREILARSRRKKTPLSNSSSPKELETAAGLSNPVLHEIYEKARYGPGECTKEDLDRIIKEEEID